MRTTRVLPYGGLPDRDPQTETPWTETTQTETPQTESLSDRDPPGQRLLDRDPLQTEDPPGQRFLRQRPPCGHTNACENITFANFVCGG